MAIFVTLVVYYVRNPATFGPIRLLLAVLLIDTARNVFENVYFGLYFGGLYGFLPAEVVQLLGQPALLIVPKVLNVMAGGVVLGLLLYRWLPAAVQERGRAERRAQELEQLAAVDSLTGLYNRHHFKALARAELTRCQRYLRPLLLLMLDVDHFKLVNDRFGHAAGDHVLRTIAQVCSVTKRDSDVAARIGGEEFALLLSETTPEAAEQFAERLRNAVRNCPMLMHGHQIVVTVSIGVAGASIRTSGFEALLLIADQALYRAKDAGRDQVIWSGVRLAARCWITRPNKLIRISVWGSRPSLQPY
jgi:diguanylate cyclase (GGDEF)-like protein